MRRPSPFAYRVRARSVLRTRSARCGVTSTAVRSAPGLHRQGPEHPRLATGAGTQVEPARGHVVGDLGRRQRQGDELGALVLHRRAPVADLRDQARVARAEHDADRRGVAGLDVVVAAQLVDGGQPGAGDDVHLRRLVVGGQQGGELGVDGGRGRAAVADQGGAQRGDDPLRGGCAAPRAPRLPHPRAPRPRATPRASARWCAASRR